MQAKRIKNISHGKLLTRILIHRSHKDLRDQNMSFLLRLNFLSIKKNSFLKKVIITKRYYSKVYHRFFD